MKLEIKSKTNDRFMLATKEMNAHCLPTSQDPQNHLKVSHAAEQAGDATEKADNGLLKI